jgi:hypothetical protein
MNALLRIGTAACLTALLSFSAWGGMPLLMRDPLPSASAPSFVGLLDSSVYGPAYLGWAIDSCPSSAYSGNLADIWDAATGSTTETQVTCSPGGVLNTSTPTTLAVTCAGGCKIKTLTNLGTGPCSGACDMVQATNALRPSVTTSCQNGLMCLVCNGTSTYMEMATGISSGQSQPYTYSIVANHSNSGQQALSTPATTSSPQIGYNTTGSNQAFSYFGGSVATATASDGSLHAVQFLGNAASSFAYVDGAAGATANAGSGSFIGSEQIMLCAGNGPSDYFAGVIFEMYIFISDLSSSFSLGNANQRTRLAF